ncbi:MAG: MarR family transcriptional regulator [Candidatus Bathyarchaeota archaeon]|nr:MarR family transcriptional regulator [Candidatus Termiticorpusculum sp.]
MKEQRKQLAILFTHLDELLFRYQIQTRVKEGFTPYSGQGRVLAILKMQPEIVQKELGYLLDISKQALSELLDKLEKNGYITRTQSEKDRRSFVIKLTDTGRQAIPNENNQTDNNYLEEIFDCLNPEEQTNLTNYIEQIIPTLEKKVNTEEDAFAEFFRERFFAKHGNKHDAFRGFWGFNHHHHRHRGFGGHYNDNDE